MFLRSNSVFSAAEHRLAFLMPPETGGGPPESGSSPDGREIPRFSLENTEGSTKDAVDRANVDSQQARNKQVNDAYGRFQLGVNRFKQGYEKAIKQAEEAGNTEEAGKLREQMNKTIEEQVAQANQRLLALHTEQGYPLYQIGKNPDGTLTFNRQTGVAAPENLNKAISNLSPRMQNAIRRLPPDRARMVAETFAGMSAADLRELDAPVTALVEQLVNLSPDGRNAVYLWLLNPTSIPNNPQALVKQLRMSEAEARDALGVIQSLQKSDPRILNMFRRSASNTERFNSAGGGAQGEAIRAIPEGNPARDAEILSAIGAPALNDVQKTNIRVALARYIEKVGSPGATEGDRDIERGNLMMMGVNPDTRVNGFKSLDEVCNTMRSGGRVEGKLAVRTVTLRELQGMQLAGALTYLLGFINKLDKKNDKPLGQPATNAERAKRIKEIGDNIQRNNEEIAKLNRELTGPPPPEAKRAEEIRKRITELETQNKSLTAERDRLQREGTNPAPDAGAERAKRLKEKQDSLQRVNTRLEAVNKELAGPPAPTPARIDELNKQKSSLEKEKKQLEEDIQKLEKEGGPGGPGGAGGPTEGPRLAPTEANRKTLNEASTKAVSAYTDAVASGTNKQLIITNNAAAQTALNNELAHLQEYAAPTAEMTTRIGEIQKSLADMRSAQVLEGGNKAQADVEAAERLPDGTPELRRTKLDALIPAHRARLAVARAGLPDNIAGNLAIFNLETQLTALINERATIGPVEHTEERRKALTEATTKAEKTRADLMASRAGPDRSGPAILAAFDASYAAAEAELAHLQEYAAPDAAMTARIGTLSSLTRSLQLGKVAETTTQLRDASDRAEALPRTNDAERVTRYTTMISTNTAELAHLQKTGGDAVRIGNLQTAIADSRRGRAALQPVPT